MARNFHLVDGDEQVAGPFPAPVHARRRLQQAKQEHLGGAFHHRVGRGRAHVEHGILPQHAFDIHALAASRFQRGQGQHLPGQVGDGGRRFGRVPEQLRQVYQFPVPLVEDRFQELPLTDLVEIRGISPFGEVVGVHQPGFDLPVGAGPERRPFPRQFAVEIHGHQAPAGILASLAHDAQRVPVRLDVEKDRAETPAHGLVQLHPEQDALAGLGGAHHALVPGLPVLHRTCNGVLSCRSPINTFPGR